MEPIHNIKLNGEALAVCIHMSEAVKIIQTGSKNISGRFTFKGKSNSNDEPDGYIVLVDVPHEFEKFTIQVGYDDGQASLISNLGTTWLSYSLGLHLDRTHGSYVYKDRPIQLPNQKFYLHWEYLNRDTQEPEVVRLTIETLPKENGVIILYETEAEVSETTWESRPDRDYYDEDEEDYKDHGNDEDDNFDLWQWFVGLFRQNRD